MFKIIFSEEIRIFLIFLPRLLLWQAKFKILVFTKNSILFLSQCFYFLKTFRVFFFHFFFLFNSLVFSFLEGVYIIMKKGLELFTHHICHHTLPFSTRQSFQLFNLSGKFSIFLRYQFIHLLIIITFIFIGNWELLFALSSVFCYFFRLLSVFE